MFLAPNHDGPRRLMTIDLPPDLPPGTRVTLLATVPGNLTVLELPGIVSVQDDRPELDARRAAAAAFGFPLDAFGVDLASSPHSTIGLELMGRGLARLVEWARNGDMPEDLAFMEATDLAPDAAAALMLCTLVDAVTKGR